MFNFLHFAGRLYSSVRYTRTAMDNTIETLPTAADHSAAAHPAADTSGELIYVAAGADTLIVTFEDTNALLLAGIRTVRSTGRVSGAVYGSAEGAGSIHAAGGSVGGMTLEAGEAGDTIPADDANALLPAALARGMILDGHARPGMQVTGRLDLSDSCIETLPAGLHCYELDLSRSQIRTLPADLRVDYRLGLDGCTRLESLPEDLKVGMLTAKGCTALRALPEGLDVYFLDISGCVGLTGWPVRGSIRIGRLVARNCSNLRSLPPYLTNIAQLDLTGCGGISELPEGITVSSWLDLTGTEIHSLPVSLHGVRLRWHGMFVSEHIVLRPETLTIHEVLTERNTELRRIMMEQMGYERFVAEANATTIDRDRDAGGKRSLLRVPVAGDEDLVCLAVTCPSTGRKYMLRVPPTTPTCRHAAAWIAGFDHPDQYQPVAET